MKAVILCVDRDDDLGVKARVTTPVVGRRRCLEAAVALGLADPEDSDVNALLAAVHLFDRESTNPENAKDQVEVAAIAGHRQMGLRGDRKLAEELDAVLELTHADQVILVSDGAEDEQVMPILQSRVKVMHVHRSVVKQAPRLEGFYYVLTRMLDEPKQSRRFVLPLSILVLVWGLGFLFGVQTYVGGAILAFFGFWLLIHAMQWDQPVARFLGDVGRGLRSGRLTFAALLFAAVIVAFGAATGWLQMEALPAHLAATHGPALSATSLRTAMYLTFFDTALPFLVVGLMVLTCANLLSAILRDGRTKVRHWTALLSLTSLYLFGYVAIEVGLQVLVGGKSLLEAWTLEYVLVLVAGMLLALGGSFLVRYVRAFQRDAARTLR